MQEVTTAWDRVYGALRQMYSTGPYHGGMSLTRCELKEGGVVAEFENGARVLADLLIGADGIRSTVRRQYVPDIAPRYVGYVAWRGIVDEGSIPSQWRARTLQHMVFCLPDGELAFSVPIADRNPAGGRRCMFVWFRPATYDSKLREWCTDASGVCHGDSIPPTLIRKEVVAELKLSAHTLLAPQLAELVASVHQPILPPSILSNLRACRSAVSCWWAMRLSWPARIGTSVTKAAQDASTLVDELIKGNVDDALAAYERRRLQAGRELVARGRRLGEHLEPAGRGIRPPIGAFLRDFGPGSIGEWPSTA